MSKFDEIEKAFAGLKKDKSTVQLTILSHKLTEEFKKTIRVQLLDNHVDLSMFVMATTPEVSTLDKVLDYAADNASKVETIVKIWQGANKWTLEINYDLIDLLSAKELTALTLHELWHIMYSDRTIRRIKDGLTFAMSTTKLTSGVITSEKFKKVLRIPGIVSCHLIFNKSQTAMEALAHKKYMEKELKADAFAADKGYRTALVDAINKLETAIGSSASTVQRAANSQASRILLNLHDRKDALARNNLSRMKNLFAGTALMESVDELYADWFESKDTDFMELFNDDLSGYGGTLPSYLFEESTLFKKRLEPIQRNQIDYAWNRASTIQSEDDRTMLLSYVDSKLELVEWYLAVADTPKLANKYKLPHSKPELLKLRLRLESVREKILNTRIAYTDYGMFGKDGSGIVMYYPTGYEG